jgi:hypothetical protein
MKKNEIYFSVYDLNIRVCSDNLKLLEYINYNLDSFELKNLRLNEVDLDIIINFSEDYNTNNLDLLQTPRIYLGSEFYIESDVVCYKEKKMQMLAKAAKPFKINGAFDLRFDQKIRKLLGFSTDFIFNSYQRIYRYMVELPLIHLLEGKGFTPLHASAVETSNGRCSLFVGLNGAGKSTYATKMAKQTGRSLLSDNFCLIKSGKVYPLPGLVKLKGKSVKDPHLTLIGKAFGKNLYKHNKKDVGCGYEVDTLSMVSRKIGQNGPIEKKILSRGDIYNRIIFVSRYLKEYPEYTYLSYFKTVGGSKESYNITKLIDSSEEYIDLIL